MVSARAMRPSSPRQGLETTAPSHEAAPNFCRLRSDLSFGWTLGMAAAVPSLPRGRRRSPKPGHQTSGLEVCAGMAMTDSNIFWQRTFPDSQPGTDGVAVFEGRIIGRIMHMTNLPRDVVVERHRSGARRARPLR